MAARWRSLDVLRGVALFMMLAHHLAGWTGGHVRDRFIGFDGFVFTDLAAPMFAVGAGAAAFLVGQRTSGAAWWRVLRRWGEVFVVGVALDLMDGKLTGGGVLPTLAVVGVAVVLASGVGLRPPWAWWLVALGGAVLAVPAARMEVEGFVPELWAGRFPVPVYLVFAAGGAAVAAHATAVPHRGGGGEAALPLVRAAVGVVAVAAALSWVAPSLVARHGIWPPHRYPGDLAFTAWGLAATLVLWAAVRSLVALAPWLTGPVARAGQRTLLIFSVQLMARLVMKRAGILGELDTFRWGLVTWGAIAVVCAVCCLPKPRWRRRASDDDPPAPPVASPPEARING